MVLAASLLAGGWAVWSGRSVSLTMALVAAFGAGAALLAQNAWRAAWRSPARVVFEASQGDSAELVVVGRLISDASLAPSGVLLGLETQWIGPVQARDGILLTVVGVLGPGRMDEWRAGRMVRAPAILRRPSRYLDPDVPDQERALLRRGIALVGTVKSAALVQVLAHGSVPSELAAGVRRFARRAIQSSVGRWSARSASIVTAIVIGDRTGLDAEVERRLQEAGTYHVIAISGGNIAILVGLTLTLFRFAGLLGGTAMLSAIVGLAAYGYLVGRGASVDRATLMAIVYLAGRILDLRGPPLNALAVVAAVLVVINPFAVSDPAFLLTFGATAAILAVAGRLPSNQVPRVAAGAISILIASAASEAALMPVSAMVFSRVTFAGLVLNLAAIPLMAIAQIAGMVVVPLSLLSERLAVVAGWIAFVGAEGLVVSARLVEIVPALTWRVAKPSAWVLAVYYGGLVGTWLVWSGVGSRRAHVPATRTRPGAFSAAVCLGASIWILAEPTRILRARGDGRLHVTFIDVGQGDASFVQFPQGDTLLVDAGGLSGTAAFDIGDRVVAPLLRRVGVRRLGTLVLTHGDADHIGGAGSLIREFHPWVVWEGVPVPPFEPLQTLRTAAQSVRSRWANVQTADEVHIDGVDVMVQHPRLPDWERQTVRNNDSIVLEIIWRDISLVLTGDIGREAEHVIVSRFAPAPLRIVKIPHHGSLTSSSQDFVRALAPRVAIVSVGRGNRFGHPASLVLQRYAEIGAEVFRTDQDGAVTLETDGDSVEIRGFTGRRARLTSGSARASREAPPAFR